MDRRLRVGVKVAVPLLLVCGVLIYLVRGGYMMMSVLPWLEDPSAEMIQTRTWPPYGEEFGLRQAPPGHVSPHSTAAAQKKGLAGFGHLNPKYAVVQNMYRAILLPRLVDQLGLVVHDQQLAREGIPAVPEDKMLFAQYAQKRAGIDLSYIYVRNNLYIERLSQAQIDAFLAHADNPGFTDDPELNQIVTDTYPRVISQLVSDDPNVMTGYDVYGGHIFYADAIVIFVAYNDKDSRGTSDEQSRQWSLYVTGTFVPALQHALDDSWQGHVSVFWDMGVG